MASKRTRPGWLRISADRKKYEVIPERAKVVRLIFWLTLRGWGKGRISRLFNRHLGKVPVWGARKKKGRAWQYSYIQKILHSRAVMGEFVPHAGRGEERQRFLGLVLPQQGPCGSKSSLHQLRLEP